MSASSKVHEVSNIVVRLIVIASGVTGLIMTYQGAQDWNPAQILIGPFLIVLCVLGGVVKRVSYGGGKWVMDTHESPFPGWRGSKAN